MWSVLTSGGGAKSSNGYLLAPDSISSFDSVLAYGIENTPKSRGSAIDLFPSRASSKSTKLCEGMIFPRDHPADLVSPKTPSPILYQTTQFFIYYLLLLASSKW
jgi:hypothetical protein